MNVGKAMRYISLKTSSAIRTAIHLELLPEEALPTAWFLEKMHDWFEIMNSRHRKMSITKSNKVQKFDFLKKIINLFQDLKIGAEKSYWKPLNKGVILSTTNVINIADYLIEKENYDYVLTSRLTQDALENVNSQIRMRDRRPSALECLRNIKLISICQYMKGVRSSSYCADNNQFLVDYCAKMEKRKAQALPVQFSAEKFKTYSLEETRAFLNDFDLNLLFFIAGTCTFKVIKCQTICNHCKSFVSGDLHDYDCNKFTMYTNFLTRGGLHIPSLNVFLLSINVQTYYRKYKNNILKNSYVDLIIKLVNDLDINFPECCSIKNILVNHFFTVRDYATKDFSSACKLPKYSYGTASRKAPK